jgi:hypothetical protein
MPPPKGYRRAKVHFGKRFGVSGWVPSRRLEEAADERTEGMVGYFLSTCSHHDPAKWQDQLYRLARSCYLQGAADTAMVAAQMVKSGTLN